MTNTYHVSGTLGRIELIGIIEWPKRRPIYREVEAVDAAEAVDSLEVDGWEWTEAPTVWLITEAMKMERGGQPSLFPLGGGKNRNNSRNNSLDFTCNIPVPNYRDNRDI